MKRVIVLLNILLASAGLCLIACSDNSIAGGTVTETTNGFVALSCGTPVSGATVLLVDPSLRNLMERSPVIDSTTTGDDGSFTLNVRVADSLNLQIYYQNNATIVPNSNVAPDDTIKLSETGSYEGILRNESGHPLRLHLLGTAYSSTVGPDGSFNFGSIASGTHTVIASFAYADTTVFALGTVFQIQSAQQLYDTTLFVDPLVVPLDKFDAGFGRPTLGHIVDDIVWYTYSDSVSRRYDRETEQWIICQSSPMLGGNTSVSATKIDDGNAGGLLTTSVVLGDAIQYPYAGLGIVLAANYSSLEMDLSSMTAFSFEAQGTGVLRVRFESNMLEDVGGNRHYTYLLELEDSWQTVQITPESLQLLPYDAGIAHDYPWSVTSSSINRIEFEFLHEENTIGDTLHFECDNMVFHGVRLEEFVEIR